MSKYKGGLLYFFLEEACQVDEQIERQQNMKTDWKTCPKFKITVVSREGGKTEGVANMRDFNSY